jgi:hypothetical protein
MSVLPFASSRVEVDACGRYEIDRLIQPNNELPDDSGSPVVAFENAGS